MTTPVLVLRAFGVGFGEQTVLSEVTFNLPPRGLTSLVGPSGSGKSTLLRTLAGLNDAHTGLSTWGTALLEGQPLLASRPRVPGELRPGVGLVVQHARFFLDSIRENLVSALPNRAGLDPASQTRLNENVVSLPKPIQRRLAVVRALAPDPLVLFADEPTAGLDDDDSIEVLSLLRVQANFRAVLFVTHNQRFAQAAGGTTVLLAGGRVQEVAPSSEFFRAPQTELGDCFVRTGGCPSPVPQPPVEAASASPPSARVVRSRYDGPRGFFWVRPGLLGGLPRPGIVASVERDVEGLQRLGVTTLVTLEEALTVDPALLRQFGIRSVHFPVADMGVPTPEAARSLCEQIEGLLARGKVVALHCRAGLGRTGTLLASQLIWAGDSARGAIDRVRQLNPQCIQSQVQVDFLSSFEPRCRQRVSIAGAEPPAMP